MSTASSTVSAKLSNFAQRLGLKQAVSPSFRHQVTQLELSLPAFSAPSNSIWWSSTPALHALHELPRNALSGPVQDDKAYAYKALKGVIYRQQWELDSVDLRCVDGLMGDGLEDAELSSLEQFNTASCRHVRIISINDLQKVLGACAAEPIWTLNEASWRGTRRFWCDPQHNHAIAAAICYARLRKLAIERAAVVNSYQLNHEGIERLNQQFHVLCMPNQAWSNEAFMSLLLGNELPYSRLNIQRGTQAGDCLILPKQHAHAHTLGQGLLALGAEDFCDYLRRLPQ